jgi:manganese/zinc/iron transport system permease protein
MTSQIFLSYDLPSLVLGACAALACALLGNFLVLRQQSLIGDAISHVVLPGIVVGFLLSGSTATAPMMLGAGAAALLAVGLIEAVRRFGRVEPGAAMGVVFTVMFAGGVLLLERSGASGVHLDVQHALYGNLESAIWLEGRSWGDLLDPVRLADLPETIFRMAAVLGVVVLFVLGFYKELKLTSFDAAFADSMGIASGPIGFALVFMTALAAVAAFDAVGSILVIAMFICPAAAARMLTDRLTSQLWLSAGFALVSAVAGYAIAAFVPIWLGTSASLSAAGTIALVAGVIQALAMVFAPGHGALARWRLSRRAGQPSG